MEILYYKRTSLATPCEATSSAPDMTTDAVTNHHADDATAKETMPGAAGSDKWMGNDAGLSAAQQGVGDEQDCVRETQHPIGALLAAAVGTSATQYHVRQHTVCATPGDDDDDDHDDDHDDDNADDDDNHDDDDDDTNTVGDDML